MQTTYAWLAGILDGEGCFTLFQKTYRSSGREQSRSVTANITITNSSAAIIDECVRILKEAGIKFTLLCPRNSHTRPLRRISVRNYASIVGLIALVEPYLVGKRDQALLMLQFVEGAQQRGSLRQDDRERFWAEMRNLNRFGSLIP